MADLAYEEQLWQKGYDLIAGVDEAGRGPLAGPVVAAAVILDPNQPIEGLVIVRGLSKDGDEWNDGKILDPKNGKLYKCYITLEEENKLKLRGYIGFSLIGRTEYWNRLQE